MNVQASSTKKGGRSEAGSSISNDDGEMELNSSVLMKYSKNYTRKRVNVAENVLSEGTTSKRRCMDSNAADALKLEVSEEMELNSSFQKMDRTPNKIQLIDDLPPEMIEAVLKHATTDDLLSCRQVNRKWKELSSGVLHHREDKALRFRYKNGHFVRGKNFLFCYLTKRFLADLLDCFKDCKNLPYSSFDFGDLTHFENENMKRFLSVRGKDIRCLKIQMVDPVKSLETLKKLLLQQVPNLKKLEIQFTSSVKVLTPIQQAFPLFQKFQLPKLEVLVVDTQYRKVLGIVESILTAAYNLKEFVYNSEGYKSITKEDLTMLQSLNKLSCLQAINIFLSEDLITYWTKSSKHLDLKLRTLHFSFGEIWGNQQLKLDATSIVNQLLKSSKDVIVTLAMEPIGLLPGVIFPKLEKLRVLDLLETPYLYLYSYPTNHTIFPQPFEMADIFPNLKELEMNVDYTEEYFPKLLVPMPSIEVLRINTTIKSSPENTERLMKMTPNVKSLRLVDELHYSEDSDEKQIFVNGFRAIVNNLKKLETFRWVIETGTHHDLLYQLDSAITGFPENFCKEILVKYRNKDKLSAEEYASIEGQRKQPSILDLKDLKEMVVTFQFDQDAYDYMDEDGERCGSECEESDCEGECKRNVDATARPGLPRSRFYKTGFTKVSEFLAFKLMPNLKIRIKRRELD